VRLQPKHPASKFNQDLKPWRHSYIGFWIYSLVSGSALWFERGNSELYIIAPKYSSKRLNGTTTWCYASARREPYGKHQVASLTFFDRRQGHLLSSLFQFYAATLQYKVNHVPNPKAWRPEQFTSQLLL
jgi:hypothetical protein